ncbi:MAG: hypothetical protein Q9209_000218 [Squamulea sp. 1 TL-2023]
MRTSGSGVKRARNDDSSHTGWTLPPALSELDTPSPSTRLTTNNPGSTTFRNVSACHRCRLRKNRCDQNLPACSLCAKAGVKCVGFDAVIKREIPRSYVYYLESRLTYLEMLLTDNGISFAPSQEFDIGAKPSLGQPQGRTSANRSVTHTTKTSDNNSIGLDSFVSSRGASSLTEDDEDRLDNLVSNISVASVRGIPDRRYLGTTSGISFARIVFAAVKSSLANSSSGRNSPKVIKPASTVNGTSMRDSFFGLHTTPSVKPAPLPDRTLGLQLVNVYFSFSNPQLPILHKEEFMSLFDRAYASTASGRSARELYMLNIVFAIGAGIFLADSQLVPSSDPDAAPTTLRMSNSLNTELLSTPSQQHQAEEYHAAAMMQMESFPGSESAMDCPGGFNCGLEELQAVLLLAGFALLRPVAPGLWYIVGVATRLGVDLGLHHEDGTDLDESGTLPKQQEVPGRLNLDLSEHSGREAQKPDANERGRREWMRDLRRRLWWCVYSFDRLVSTCVGRPFGITDQVITTDFPALLNDEQITRSGFAIPSESFTGPSYKRVSHHYFRLRLLQSEILQVLQYRQAKQTRVNPGGTDNQYMYTRLPSSFLQPFESFKLWRQDIDRRLWEWKVSAPLQEDVNVYFDVRFLELNYWQMIIMLYRQSLGAEPRHDGSGIGSDEIHDFISMDLSDGTEDEDIHLKLAEAGQRVLVLYQQLHWVHLVSYTYLATVHIFMAGIAFLYVLWHSHTVRSRMTVDDVESTILAATQVLGDLSQKCPPAEACRHALKRMSRATVQMCISTTGFGSSATGFETQHSHGSNRDGSVANGALVQPKRQKTDQNPLRNKNGRGDHVDCKGRSGQELNDRLVERPASQDPVMTLETVAYRSPPNGSPSELATECSSGLQSDEQPAAFSLGLNDPLHERYDTMADPEVDLLLAGNEAMIYDTDFGMDLGFGNEHDWSNGLQLELFDGFFFGGNTGTPVS